MKTCNICNKSKPENDFPLRDKNKGTRQNRCKQCQREYSKAHYKANKDKHNKRRYINAKRTRDKLRKFIKNI